MCVGGGEKGNIRGVIKDLPVVQTDSETSVVTAEADREPLLPYDLDGIHASFILCH